MATILTSLHGRRVGIDNNDNLVLAGKKVRYNTDRVTSITASVTLTEEDHGDQILALNVATGATLTLPDATGSGVAFEVIVLTAVTSNSYIIKVPDANNVMVGHANLHQDAADTIVSFDTASTSDTITMNGSTTGGLAGARIRLVDVAADKWFVDMESAATGIEATPFSAAV